MITSGSWPSATEAAAVSNEKFTRFHGVMRYDPQQPGKCQVMLDIDPSSLQMSSKSMTERVTGSEFMDVARYPNMGRTHSPDRSARS